MKTILSLWLKAFRSQSDSEFVRWYARQKVLDQLRHRPVLFKLSAYSLAALNWSKKMLRFTRRVNAGERFQRWPQRSVLSFQSEYHSKQLHIQPDNFVLYRIIGNDLPPRHKQGQALENLRFILEHEPPLADCHKRWVVNRIIDQKVEHAILKLLKQHDQPYLHIPFVRNEYAAVGFDTECLPERGFLASKIFEEWRRTRDFDRAFDRLLLATYRLKNNYVMNNNGARNAALRDGRQHAKWILPWDGNCYLTAKAWSQIRDGVKCEPWLKYFAVPMARVVKNEALLQSNFVPDPVEEPQLIFRKDALEEFNETFSYGRRPKVELFWRLQIPGKWSDWTDDPWDQDRRPISVEAKQFQFVGWVARLNSGAGHLEKNSPESWDARGRSRRVAILDTLQKIDAETIEGLPLANRLSCLRLETLKQEAEAFRANREGSLFRTVKILEAEAEAALTRGPYSVKQKTTLPPSEDPHDYWHPAPYWWPNPYSANGLPFIFRDGQRVPGTMLSHEDSDKYDRSRLQRLFDDTSILVMAWTLSGRRAFADHAVRLIRCWFLDPETRMNPHLRYAQVRMGHNNNEGSSTGIIEMKDLYYVLDAFRLLDAGGCFAKRDTDELRSWLSNYLDWLLNSEQGMRERCAANNHGTYYDLQLAAIAAFLEERGLLYECLIRAQSRIEAQISPDGRQEEELTRSLPAHYCCYNMQGWLNLVELGRRWGVDLWAYRTSKGASLERAVQWILRHQSESLWPFNGSGKFDNDRLVPLRVAVSAEEDPVHERRYEWKPLFSPYDGIRPFWNLGMSNPMTIRVIQPVYAELPN